jgi:deoxyadenosine/deoxycytidine kinase
MIISIEADIGGGKSTFLKMLNEKYPDLFCVIYEPLDEWLKTSEEVGDNILGLLYKDIDRWAYTFQHNAFLTRVQKIENERDDSKIIVTERSVISDYNVFAKMLRDDRHINDIEYKIYLNWMEFLNKKHNTIPDKIVYLRTDPKVAHSRLMKRNRNEEKGVSLEYLEKVNKYHEDWLINGENNIEKSEHQPLEVIVLDGNQEFETNPEIFEDMVKKIFS